MERPARPIQYFSDEYLAQCRKMSTEQILEYLENFRLLNAPTAKLKGIDLRVPEPLLAAFRKKCELQGLRYQSQIKQLMQAWLMSGTENNERLYKK